MSAERPWVRGQLPWLGDGPLYRVHESARPALDEYLARFPYRRIDVDGRLMTSRSAAHAELARAFAFPDYHGENWDAFNDCFGDFVLEHDGELIAVVWNHVEAAAHAAAPTTVEVGWALLECTTGSTGTPAEGFDAAVALDVFVVGDGDDFDRP